MSLPLCVITDSRGQTVGDVSSFSGLYIREILAHAGIPFDEIEMPVDNGKLKDRSLVILPWHLSLEGKEKAALAAFVNDGGALVGLGGTSGLDTLVGVEDRGAMEDGYLQIVEDGHPLVKGFASSLHCFGGRRIKATEGRVICSVVGASDGVVENRPGAGLTIVVGPDLVSTIVRIQQGHDVPPAEGPTRIDVIKGLTLDLDRDRSPINEEEGLAFLEPICDELRGLIIRSILYACSEQDIRMPILWYWPENTTAIAHMSHDSDGGDKALGWSLFRLTQEVGIQTTWCIMADHYEPEFYEEIKSYGSEVALHYDAQSYQTAGDDAKPGVSHLKWGFDEFVAQLDTVSRSAGIPVTTNKNHTLRWQGRLEFFRWCEKAGISVEQSKGPNTPYTNGFPFGGSHPWFPIEDDEDGRMIDVLEVNLTVQDIHRRCSTNLATQFADRVYRHYGIGHYLFHPAHVWDPAVRGGLRAIVGFTRDLQMPWWTAARIGKWERARRSVSFERAADGEFQIRSKETLEDATVLITGRESATVGGRSVEQRVDRYGFSLATVTLDIVANEKIPVNT
jgi:hypothetical protein